MTPQLQILLGLHLYSSWWPVCLAYPASKSPVSGSLLAHHGVEIAPLGGRRHVSFHDGPTIPYGNASLLVHHARHHANSSSGARAARAKATEVKGGYRPPALSRSTIELEQAVGKHLLVALLGTEVGVKAKATVEAAPAALLPGVFGSSILLVICVISFLYWQRGLSVICRVLLYLFSLSTIKISIRYIFVEHQYHFPMFLTGMHLLGSSLIALFVLSWRRLTSGTPINVPSLDDLWFRLLPIMGSFTLSLALNNYALMFCSAAFTEVIGATSPLVTVFFVILLGMPFSYKLLSPTCVVVLGCLISCTGEIHFSKLGTACCFMSNMARGAKTALQQEVLTGIVKDKFDPCTLLMWTCAISSVAIFSMSACSEGLAPWVVLNQQTSPSLLIVICLSVMNACVLNFAQLFVIKDLGAVGVQLVAQVKSGLTVLAAAVLLHETLSPLECFGFICVFYGTYKFSRTEQREKDRLKAAPEAVEAEAKPSGSKGVENFVVERRST